MNDTKSIERLSEKVEAVLRDDPETRNDDALLTFRVIVRFLPGEVWEQKDGERTKTWVSTFALKRVREDHVKRIRAKIQNDEGRLLPTDPEVRRQRRINEERWKEYLSR